MMLFCLATAVFFEARGEEHVGQMAVAAVIVNRMLDSRYPDTICEVVWEPKAFSFTHDGIPETMHDAEARKQAYDVAALTLDGFGLGITSTHYHTTSIKVYWSTHYELDGVLGSHVFYTNETPYK